MKRPGPILVTGATGNVGQHVAASLASAGTAARALVRDPDTAVLPEDVERVRGDPVIAAHVEPRCAVWRPST